MLLLFRKKTLKGLTGYKGAFRKDTNSLGRKKDDHKKAPHLSWPKGKGVFHDQDRLLFDQGITYVIKCILNILTILVLRFLK